MFLTICATVLTATGGFSTQYAQTTQMSYISYTLTNNVTTSQFSNNVYNSSYDFYTLNNLSFAGYSWSYTSFSGRVTAYLENSYYNVLNIDSFELKPTATTSLTISTPSNGLNLYCIPIIFNSSTNQTFYPVSYSLVPLCVDNTINYTFSSFGTPITNTYVLGFKLFSMDENVYSALTSNDSAQEMYNNGYEVGYDEGYDSGYDTGYTDGQDESTDRLQSSFDNGYNQGYQQGLTDSAANPYTFGALFGAVADTPILIVRSMFNFDFFGVNVLTVVLSLFTAFILFYLLRKLF